MKKSGIRTLVVLVILAALAGTGYLFGPRVLRRTASLGGGEGSEGPEEVRLFTVRRGPLRIGFVEDGVFRAVKNHVVRSLLQRHAKISWIIPEGTQVKQGDKLIEFEKKDVEDDLEKMKAELETAKKELKIAEEDLKIEQASGISLVANAQTKLDEAKLALVKFKEIEARKQFRDLEASVRKEEGERQTAQNNLVQALREGEEELFVDEDQRKTFEKRLAEARNAVDGAKQSVNSVVLQQKMFKMHDYPEQLAAKKRAVENAELELAKSKQSSVSQFHKKEIQINRVKNHMGELEEQLERAAEDVRKCVATAPVDGMVLYGEQGEADMESYARRGGGEIKVGMDVWPRTGILTIPDFSAFDVDFCISEERRGKVRQGAPATVTAVAVPDLVLQGELKKVANLATPRFDWDESSPKVFFARVVMSGTDSRLVSGMTARVEIVVETLADVISVPIESVFNEGGAPVCYVQGQGGKTERRPVKLGASSDAAVEVKDGLCEGDRVHFFRPKDFAAGGGAPPVDKP